MKTKKRRHTTLKACKVCGKLCGLPVHTLCTPCYINKLAQKLQRRET
jgi:maltose-binding protein MalE